jgi:hypothetical protein
MQENNLMAFYEVGKTHLYSIAVMCEGEYRTQYDKETLADLRAQGRTSMELLPFDDACKLIDDAQMAAYCHAPVEITKQKFWEMLEVLPPCKWTRKRLECWSDSLSTEAFYVSEPLAADIHAWHVRIGGRYWSLNRSRTRSPDSIIAEVATAAGVTL